MKSGKLRIPLAWLQLTYDKRRFAAALSGIVFAVALMLIQMGFRDALYQAAIQIHEQLDGDLFLLSKQYQYLVATRSYSRRVLYDLVARPEVKSVVPVYMGLSTWVNPETKKDYSIFVIGYDPTLEATLLPGMAELQRKMALPEEVLFDAGSKPDYGTVRQRLQSGGKFETEVAGRRVDVAGLFTIGVTFASDANLITSDQNFLRLMPYHQEGLIDLGIIKLQAGINPRQARDALTSALPPGLQLFTKQDYLDYEQGYWAKRTPIGFVFNLGVFVGFIVGAVIVYQILYTDVMDHIGEYATLKAMGYTNKYLSGVVLREAVVLCLFGYVPGWLISTGVAILTRRVTLIPCYMTWERSLTVLTMTMGMCIVSALMAVRKLRLADPADIF